MKSFEQAIEQAFATVTPDMPLFLISNYTGYYVEETQPSWILQSSAIMYRVEIADGKYSVVKMQYNVRTDETTETPLVVRRNSLTAYRDTTPLLMKTCKIGRSGTSVHLLAPSGTQAACGQDQCYTGVRTRSHIHSITNLVDPGQVTCKHCAKKLEEIFHEATYEQPALVFDKIGANNALRNIGVNLNDLQDAFEDFGKGTARILQIKKLLKEIAAIEGLEVTL